MKSRKILTLFLSFIFLIPLLSDSVHAHCPLCTAGAAVAAGGAVWLGVSKVVVALFIGAFAVSTGWWFSRLVKKQIIPFQKSIIILISFLLTIIPMLPFLSNIYPIYISLFGQYGSILNRTYILDLSLISSIFGGFVVGISPLISRKLSKLRNGEILPFQGVAITLLLLIISGATIQIIM